MKKLFKDLAAIIVAVLLILKDFIIHVAVTSVVSFIFSFIISDVFGFYIEWPILVLFFYTTILTISHFKASLIVIGGNAK